MKRQAVPAQTVPVLFRLPFGTHVDGDRLLTIDRKATLQFLEFFSRYDNYLFKLKE